MRKFIGWLHENRRLNIAIAGIYFLGVVLPHEIVGRFIMNDLFGSLSRPMLNATVLIISLVLFSIFLFIVIKNLVRGGQRKSKLIYLFITLGLIVIVYNTLFVLATESAHFPQYALMAILIFPLTLNYNNTLYLTTLFGGLDEAYQYFFLNPNATGYFDFNDVITDLLGAVLGLFLLWNFEIKETVNSKPWYKRRAFLIGMAMLVLMSILIRFGIISVYPDDNGNYITLMKKVPPSYWSYDKVGDLFYHVVHPMEGMIIILILFGIYSHLGSDEKQYQ